MDLNKFSSIDITSSYSRPEHETSSRKMSISTTSLEGRSKKYEIGRDQGDFHSIKEPFNFKKQQRYSNITIPLKSRIQKRSELQIQQYLPNRRCSKFKNSHIVDCSRHTDEVVDIERIPNEKPFLIAQSSHRASLTKTNSNESLGNIELTKQEKLNSASRHHPSELSLLQDHNSKGTSSTDDDNEKLCDEHEEPKQKRFGPLQIAIDQPLLASMLLFIPLGIIAYFLQWSDSMVFFLNFMGIIPQAWLIGKATEDLATHLGQVLGGILNAWFGNIVEMLLCVAAIRANELVVVKSTLVGSILSNLLLVAGCSFLLGGFFHKVQEFSAIGASTNASLMTLSCLCLGLPTLYGTINPSSVSSELNMSRSVSVLLIFMYIQYMVFQTHTHSFLFEEDEEEEDADLSIFWASIILGICTLCCAVNSEFLIHSIEGTVDSWNISKGFIGIILLPIIGNAAEHYTSVVVAMRNKMDLSLACAIGSSCQMALFVTPLTVLSGWIVGAPMSLDLGAFEMAVLLLAVLVVTSILQDGYSNWLEGSMLISAYVVIALMYFFENPDDRTPS